MELSWVDLALAAWIGAASALSLFMLRRGHSGPRWVVIAFLLGPFAVLLASWARYRSRSSRPGRLPDHPPPTGGVAVLVGFDGSAEALNALRSAVQLFTENIGRLTLAYVVALEHARRPRSHERRSAELALAEAATVAEDSGCVVEASVILGGEPASALVAHALANDDELIVVGPHWGGKSTVLRPNVATVLARQTAVPVVILNGSELPAGAVRSTVANGPDEPQGGN